MAGHWVSQVHGIGRVEQGSRITITFESDFDPVAGATIVNPDSRQGLAFVDDDSGGNLEPLVSFTASTSGTLALYVAGYDGLAGCYHFKVDIQGPAPPPTASEVAPTLGRTLGSVVLAALHRGATGSAAFDSRPPTLLARLLTWLSPTLQAQSTRWTASCPGGGGARIELPDTLPFIGQVSLVNTTTVWTSCAMSVGGAAVTANGRTTLNGTWSATAPSSPIQIQGSLDVSDIGSLAVNVQVDGATGAFNGQIGNIPVGGVIDGPFIPRPSPPAPSPTPTPAPTPPGVTQFDGTYSGSYTGTFGSFGPQNGPVAFSVSNGVITVTQPGSGSGTVNAAGSASFSGSLGVQGVSCTFTGTFLATGGAASASGNWNCSGLGQTGSGTWSATRSS
ncbi:MAG: hypothetical protein HY657_19960 [Acidobacteria bacterium]|nr:hypothetical protein [Acidobacteriota bacterium]